MEHQTFYPIFDNGQALTSENLNDIIDYLEPQDRLTRVRLSGIGIVCGLVPDWDAGAQTLTLSCGAAVTSEGYLIAEDEVVLDRFRPYTVPIPSAPDATPEEKAEARYPFLFDGNTQREAFELLPTDFQPAPGEAAPGQLTSAFVADKTVMLFLERQREALKTCDVNDCSDKGSEMNLTLRRLLIPRATADKILTEEAAIAGRPVDRAKHPRLGLAPLAMEKINPSAKGIVDIAGLHLRYLETAANGGAAALPAMRAAYEAYRAYLADYFPAADFPKGVVPDHHFLNMLAHWAENPALGQYLHGGMHDVVRSYNEFLETAARLDAECCPTPERFPRHVLAGDVIAQPIAFAKAPATLAEFKAYDPLAATGGAAPEGLPAARRHHFVPSPLIDGGTDRTAEMRSLFARMLLVAQTYFTRNLLEAPVRITPSRDGATPLGERAVPFFYRFEQAGDLFRNWSWRKARAQLLGTVHAYAFTPDSDKGHPLALRQDEDDFLRIEGVVGKPLGTVWAELNAQRRRLGLSFAVAPVFAGYGGPGDQASEEDAAALGRALQAVGRILLCRMRDLDVIFLMIMAMLFAFLVALVQALAKLDATKATPRKSAPAGAPAAAGPAVAIATRGALRLDLADEAKIRLTTQKVLVGLRAGTTSKETLVKEIVTEAAGEKPLEKVAVATIYDRVRDERIGGELIDRVRTAVVDLGVAGDRDELSDRVYPSIALMARAEEMMEVASASSVAEFDQAKFTTAYRGLADAYDTYAARAETDATKVDAETAQANVAIVANRDTVAAVAEPFANGAFMAELQKRLLAMFTDVTLPGYAARHPGMEHKAGVPVGGTFVLVCADRRTLPTGFKRALEGASQSLRSVFPKLTGATPPDVGIETAVEALMASSKPQTDDILDEFVVLADFCLPYLCCENECGDDEVDRRITGGKSIRAGSDSGGGGGTVVRPTRPVVVEPRRGEDATGAVEISVFLRQANDVEAARRGATLQVTELSTDKTTERVLDAATASLKLPPGKYAFAAISGTRKSKAVRVALEAGATEQVRLVIL